MKTKHLKITLAVFAATLTLVLFGSIALPTGERKPAAISLEGINEASRVSHAKELLGRHYRGSDAQKMEGKRSMNLMLYTQVQSQLAPQWKGHARKIVRTVITESAKYKLDPVFVLAVIKTESKFNPLTLGSFGEIGLMQIKPDTAAWIAEKYDIPFHGEKTLKNPEANIRIGLAYMNYLREEFDGKALRYVSAYNMGPKNVRRLIAQNVKPAEYNERVMRNYFELYSTIVPKKSTVVAKVASN